MKLYKRSAALSAVLAVLVMVLGACETGQETISPSSLVVKNVEVKGNQINVLASKTLEPGVYVFNNPPKMVVEMKNASVDKNAAKSGQGSGDIVKSWTLEGLTLGQGKEDQGLEPIKSARLKIELTRDITYKLSSESSGFTLTLEELPRPVEPPKKQVVEIPPELYPQVAKAYVEARSSVVAPPEETRRVPPPPPPQRPRPAMTTSNLPGASVVTGVTFATVGGGFETTITGDGSLNDYKFFKLDSPARVVVDIFGVRKNKAIKEIIPVNNREIRQIRVGAHPDSVRVVIELTGNIKDVRITPVGGKLVVQVYY